MTKKITLLFPGQGSQYVGMGKNIDLSYMDRANSVLGYDLKTLMLDGPEENLKLTENTQPAILTHSIGLWEKLRPFLKENHIEVEFVLGHSVGEYAALVAAEVLSFEDAVKLVHLRGKYMQEAVPTGKGKMFAVMKVPENVVQEACAAVSLKDSEVMPANYNDPSQIVISGEAMACQRAVDWLAQNFKESHRCVELNVSAPFHSSLMKPAAEKLKTAFENVKWNHSKVKYIANINTEIYPINTPSETIKENLYQQAFGSVQWTQSIQKLPSDTLCLELGPSKVLMGLVRRINKDIKVIPMDKDNFDEALAELKEALK